MAAARPLHHGDGAQRLTAPDPLRTDFPATVELTVDRDGLDPAVTALQRQVDRIRDELAGSPH